MGSKNVLIGGGSGFIGQRLGEFLRLHNFNVINVSRSTKRGQLTWGDLQMRGLPDNLCAVVNCAGEPIMDVTRQWKKEYKQLVRDSRVGTTTMLATLIREAKHKPAVFLVMSDTSRYECLTSKVYDEESATNGTGFWAELATKVENAAVVDPVRLVILRSGFVLGRTGGLINRLFMTFYIGLGGVVGTGMQYMPWIHRDDLVRLMAHAIVSENYDGPVNAVSPQVITNSDFTKAFATTMKREANVIKPSFMMSLAFGSERADLLLSGACVMPKKAIKSGFNYIYPDIGSACKEFTKVMSDYYPPRLELDSLIIPKSETEKTSTPSSAGDPETG